MGRQKNSKDRAETSRSVRHHSGLRAELERVVSWFARNENTYTYRDIGRVQLLTHDD